MYSCFGILLLAASSSSCSNSGCLQFLRLPCADFGICTPRCWVALTSSSPQDRNAARPALTVLAANLTNVYKASRLCKPAGMPRVAPQGGW